MIKLISCENPHHISSKCVDLTAERYSLENGTKEDPYAQLYAPAVVEAIGQLHLPRYGLGQYVDDKKAKEAASSEREILKNLGRAGKRLVGFSRTNLFRRLESGGETFLQSLERHALRNFIFLYALESGLALPLGSQGSKLLDLSRPEMDNDPFFFDEETGLLEVPEQTELIHTLEQYRTRAQQIYARYAETYPSRFKWISSSFFQKKLKKHLLEDAQAILSLLAQFGSWEASEDSKFQNLWTLLTETHPQQKVLVFTLYPTHLFCNKYHNLRE